MGSFEEPPAGVETSAHRERLFHDHALAARYGFATVWETAGWQLAERRGAAADLGWLHEVLDSAGRHRLQVAWTLLDRTWPADLDPRQADPFVARLRDFAAAVARHVAAADPRPLHVYRPIRSGTVLSPGIAAERGIDPTGADIRLQQTLTAASRAATAAIRANDPKAWIVEEETMVAAPGAADGADGVAVVQDVSAFTDTRDVDAGLQVQAFLSLVERLDRVWERQRKPLVVFGTRASGDARGPALETMAQAVGHAGASGIELHGLCIGPLLDEPSAGGDAVRRGLWSVDRQGMRIPEPAYARSVSRCQRTALPRRSKAPATNRPGMEAADASR